MSIAVGCDHRGFAAKQRIKDLLRRRGLEVEDYGTDGTESSDYPDAALPTAAAVAERRSERGILCCGTGIGMSIAANKVVGIRAALVHDELTAEMARRHNDANVLCLPVDLLSDEALERLVSVWLDTPFDGGRHERRVNKIAAYESNGRVAAD